MAKGLYPLKSIAQANDLSEHYLEQLIAPLRNAGLVRSIRGAYGGYVLADEPGNITQVMLYVFLKDPLLRLKELKRKNQSKGHYGSELEMLLKMY